jgi:hypothetical protein
LLLWPSLIALTGVLVSLLAMFQAEIPLARMLPLLGISLTFILWSILWNARVRVMAFTRWKIDSRGLGLALLSARGDELCADSHRFASIYRVEQVHDGLKIQLRNADILTLSTDVFEHEDDERRLLEFLESKSVKVVRHTPS